ncbi:hypothetical protein [Sphingomonas bacterium]|uniref:hypothetical protein n=1 Tax=Sphingomonas bacterium TaxID=1895847 RepID=UPI00262E0508|nr:hypothetical protein [Sphingomonas bacterium]MDB5678534.1 hypothetical protein [Sphingomonas bacterium]
MSCETPAPRTATRCGPCSPSERNRYFREKRLTVADFELEQGYLIGRRRLINRAMLGWGVVEGFAIDLRETGVAVGPGMALDTRGRELVACDPVELIAPDDVLWLGKGECGWTAGEPLAESDAKDQRRGHYLLRAHYAEASIDGVRIDDDCGGARCEGNHVCETVVYSLTPVELCPPGLPDCPCEGDDAKLDPVWSEKPVPPGDPDIVAVHDRGPHDQLVDWSLARHDPDLCARPHLTRVGHLHVALDDGVPLACVGIAFNCGKAHIAAPIDDHHARRLAYPNNTLFDLIRGCDLTRIQDVGWHRWLPRGHRRVPFDQFAAMFVAPPRSAASGPKLKKGRPRRPPVDTKFWVTFSGPVQVESLTPDVLAMTIVQRDTNEDVGTMYRVPIEAVAVAEPTGDDPKDTTRAFRPLVAARFWEGEINPDNSSGFEGETLVEIEVRTGFIVDVRGQEVAGGGRFVPTDGCTPGGRFLSSFVVLAEEDEAPPAADDPDVTATPDPIDTIKQAASPSAEEA